MAGSASRFDPSVLGGRDAPVAAHRDRCRQAPRRSLRRFRGSGDAAARQKIESLINKLLWTDSSEAVDKYNEGIGLKKNGKSEEALSRFNEAIGIDRDQLVLGQAFRVASIVAVGAAYHAVA